MDYPKQIEDLVNSLAKLPSVGKKSALRLAFHILFNFDDEDKQNFIEAIQNLNEIKFCSKCNNITLNDTCDICSNDNRNKEVIMVVENIKDLISLESTNVFNGNYYVLKNLMKEYQLISKSKTFQ